MSTLPPVLVGHPITVNAGHTVINLVFNEPIARGTGSVIVTDGALQTVIDRSTGLPSTRVVGATDTHEISLDLVGFSGNTATVNADGLLPNHNYRVFILPGVLQSNGLPFAGVANGNLLTFNSGPALDTTAPGLVGWALDNWTFNGAHSSAQLTLTFTEAVAQFAASAFQATGLAFGTPSSTDGMHWTVAVTAQSGVDVSNPNIAFDLSRVRDLAGNASLGFSTLSYTIDTKPPTVSSFTLSDNRLSHNGTVEVTVKFSESVKSFPASAFTVPNAQMSDTLTTTDGGITWKGTLSTNANTNAVGNVLELDMSQVQDLSGNAGSGSAQPGTTYDVDVIAPTATLSLSDTHLSSTQGVTLTISFSEAVRTLDPSWLTTAHGSLSNLAKASADGSTWTATLTTTDTASSTGNLVALDLGHVQDLAGNTGSGSATATYDVDAAVNTALAHVTGIAWYDDTGERADDFITRDPTVALHGLLSGPLAAGQAVEITVGDYHLSPQVIDDHWYYSPTTAPTLADGTYTVSVLVTDGSTSSTAFSQTLVIDTTAPAKLNALVLAEADDSGTSRSDQITNVVKPTFVGIGAESNATIELLDSDRVIGSVKADASGNWQVSPTADLANGVHALSVRQVDVAGNPGTPSDPLGVTIDTSVPTVVSWTTSVTNGTFQLRFNEPVLHTGLTGSADVVFFSTALGVLHFPLSESSSWNDTASQNGEPSVFSFNFTPLDVGHVEVALTGVQDLAGNVITDQESHTYSFTILPS
jgi:hypothetical protein